MKKIQSKMSALEWLQHTSNYKSMGIFSDAQGQLTPQPIIESGRNSNSVETLWLSLFPVRMKKVRLKIWERAEIRSHPSIMHVLERRSSQK